MSGKISMKANNSGSIVLKSSGEVALAPKKLYMLCDRMRWRPGPLPSWQTSNRTNKRDQAAESLILCTSGMSGVRFLRWLGDRCRGERKKEKESDREASPYWLVHCLSH